MKIWTCGSSPRSGSRNAWTRIKNVHGASRLSNYWNYFGAIQIISCRNWWSWEKPSYITMTRKQSNNQWSGGIATHPAPENSECKNPLLKFSSRFFEIKTASSLLIIFQRAKLSTWSIAHLCWCNSRASEGKTPQEGHQKGLVFARQSPDSPGTRNPEETGLSGFPMSCSPTLFSWSGLVGRQPVPWTEKAIERSPFFARSFLPRRPGWTDNILIFFECLAKVRAMGSGVYWASWRVCWINPEFGRCSLFPSWSG